MNTYSENHNCQHRETKCEHKDDLLEQRIRNVEMQMMQNMCISTALTTQLTLKLRYFQPIHQSWLIINCIKLKSLTTLYATLYATSMNATKYTVPLHCNIPTHYQQPYTTYKIDNNCMNLHVVWGNKVSRDNNPVMSWT